MVETLVATTPARPRPLPARYARRWSAVLFANDLLVSSLALFVARFLTGQRIDVMLAREGAIPALSFAVVLWLMLFERIGVYRRTFSSTARDEVYASLAACAMAMLPSVGLFLSVPALVPARHLLIVAALLTAVGVCATRYLGHVVRLRLFPGTPRRIAVIGSPERVAALPSELSLREGDTVLRLPVIGFDDETARALSEDDLGALDWIATAVGRGCNEFIITEALPPELVTALLRFAEPRGIRVAFAPMRFRPHAYDFSIRRDGGIALIYPQSLAICTPGATTLRRLIDLAIALPAAIILSPVLAAVALAIRLDDGGPIVFRQVRVGRGSVPFEIFKFRTMRPDAERWTGPIWAQSGEDRTTRIGRFLRRTSLDELPQLANVIRGEMSIVGPRPERPYYVERFRKILPRYDERHLVRPGMTGWSHVHMDRDIDPSQIGERLSYDIFYLEHWSVFMDFTILCKTTAEFLFHSPA